DVEVVEMLLAQEAIFAPEFYKKKHFIFIDFYCKSKDQQVKLDQNEIQDYTWVYPGAAYNLKLDSFTRKTLDRYLKRGYSSSSSDSNPRPGPRSSRVNSTSTSGLTFSRSSSSATTDLVNRIVAIPSLNPRAFSVDKSSSAPL